MADKDRRVTDPKQALRIARIVWGVMLMGLATVGAIVFVLLSSADRSAASGGQGETATVLAIVGLVVLLTATFAAYFLRQQAFKKGWNGNATSPQAFLEGTVFFVAPIEGAAVATSILAYVDGRPLPLLALTALSIALLAINFPTGSPMEITLPDLTRS